MSSDLSAFDMLNYWRVPHPASCRWGLHTCSLAASRISALLLLTFVVKMAAEELLRISEPVCHVACLTLAFSAQPLPPPPLMKSWPPLAGNSLQDEGLG